MGIAQETTNGCDTIEMRRGHLDNSGIFKKKTLVRLAIVSPIPSGALSVVRKETYRQNGQKDVEQTD